MRPQPPTTAAQTEFLDALASWSGRPIDQFPIAAPPCNAIGSAEEDAFLARTFAQLATAAPYFDGSRNLAITNSAIAISQRHLELAWNAARGAKPGQVADRSTWVQMKPYEAMIAVLHVWHEALFDQMVGVAA